MRGNDRERCLIVSGLKLKSTTVLPDSVISINGQEISAGFLFFSGMIRTNLRAIGQHVLEINQNEMRFFNLCLRFLLLKSRKGFERRYILF